MKRSEFVRFLGGAAVALPLAAQAQPATMPVIGFLHSGAPEQNVKRLAAFRKGLADAGFVEGRNVAIEFRWASGQNAKLPELAADLIARQVAVIVTLSSTPAAVAARAATQTIPIFFLIADPPVELGLVASFNRPGGNATGIITLNVELMPKRLELLREIAPKAGTLAVLLNPNHPSAKSAAATLQATAATLGVPFQVVEASNDREIEMAYQTLKPGVAMLIGTDPAFFVRRAKIVALSAQHAVPTIFDNVEAAMAGGLMSYGANVETLWQQAGGSVARLLKGEKPATMPVAQPTKFELVLNLKTAKALGLEIPARLMFSADETIE
jgi:putative ABC transport system substrate-binding protein